MNYGNGNYIDKELKSSLFSRSLVVLKLGDRGIWFATGAACSGGCEGGNCSNHIVLNIVVWVGCAVPYCCSSWVVVVCSCLVYSVVRSTVVTVSANIVPCASLALSVCHTQNISALIAHNHIFLSKLKRINNNRPWIKVVKECKEYDDDGDDEWDFWK